MADTHPHVLITTQPATAHVEAFTAKLLLSSSADTVLAGRARVCLVNADEAARAGESIERVLDAGGLGDYASLFERSAAGTYTPALMTQLGEDLVAVDLDAVEGDLLLKGGRRVDHLGLEGAGDLAVDDLDVDAPDGAPHADHAPRVDKGRGARRPGPQQLR